MRSDAGLERAEPGNLRVVSSLRHRNYRIFWFGLLTSVIGVQVQIVAQGYLIFDKTGSALDLGIVSGAQSVSSIVLALIGGVVADRIERRKLLLLTQAGSFGCCLALAILVQIDSVHVWNVALIAFIFGAVSAFDRPTRSSLVPQLVPRSDLLNAVALSSAVWEGSSIVGPAIAGVVIAFAGLATCFYMAAAGFLVFFVALLIIEIRPREQDEGAKPVGMMADMGAGLAYIRRNSLFVAIIGMAFLNAVFGLSFVVLMPVFALEQFDVGSQGLGALFTAMGVGTLSGTLFVAGLGDSSKKGLLIVGGACLFGGLLICFSLSSWLSLSLALLVVIGVVRSLYTTSLQALLQMRLDDRYRGRVTAIYTLQWSLSPLGGVWAGLVADVWGAPAAVALGGAAVVGFSLLIGLLQPEFLRMQEPALVREGPAPSPSEAG